MRTTSLAILLFFAWATPLVAEQFSFQETPGVITYRVASNFFSAVVRHPFRVVRLSGRNLRGTLRFNPAATMKGISYNLELDVSELDEPPEGALARTVGTLLGAPKIKIIGESFTNVNQRHKEGDPYRFMIRPRIEIGKRVSYPEMRVEGTVDGKVIRWVIHSDFTLTDFSIPIPTKWGIPAEDKVAVEGEISFSPKE